MKQPQDPIHIAFCVNDRYVPYITVTIKSIVENHPHCDVDIHVLIDKISASNRQRLAEAVSGCERARVHVYLVNDASLSGLRTGVWTIYTWYRILLPEILPAEVKKVLYLDADTLVVTDLQELFATDMTDRSIAGSLDIQTLSSSTFERCGYDAAKKYVCAGVLLMNLDYWRRENLQQKLIDWANANYDRIAFADQDTINHICQDSKIILPLRFNVMKVYLTEDLHTQPGFFEEVKACAYHPAIVHYGGFYPWVKFFATHPMQGDWERYNKMLRRPVRSVYIPRKWFFLKVIFWHILHPFDKRSLIRKQGRMTLDEVKLRLEAYES